MKQTEQFDTYEFGSIKKPSLLKSLNKDKRLYVMLIPAILYFVIFKYLPMFGLVVAFQDYSPFLGFFHSHFVGLKHFTRFFSDPTFWNLLRNTLILAIYNIIFYFPLPIILSLLLNEVKNSKFKKLIQSLVYMPHFISWVVIAGICFTLLSPQDGVMNEIIKQFGGKPIDVLGSASWFRPLITFQVIWKETGYGTIIFLAALAGVDVQLYEAAMVDGCNRWKQLIHVTMPAIKSTIVILLILRMGSFLDIGFEQLFLMLNSLNRGVGEVFDTYVYSAAMQNGQFSYSVAVGMFKSVIAFILVISTNYLAKKSGEEGLY